MNSRRARSSLVVLATVLACAGMGCAVDEAVESSVAQHLDAQALVFGADWSVTAPAELVAGSQLLVDYAPARALCSGDLATGPAWVVTGYYRFNGGTPTEFWVAGRPPWPTAPGPSIPLDQIGELEIWFHHTNRWGCSAYDSNFGQNYRFVVGPSTQGPSWVGNARYAIDRATCDDGKVCSRSWRTLDDGFLYSTWARQRAALRRVGFEAWQPGVTDWDNPMLWQQLDARVRYRFRGQAEFVEDYVNFERRWGNSAHYEFDLRSLDPFEQRPGTSVVTREDCPAMELRRDATGFYVETDVEFTFLVNGVAVRQPSGEPFRGTFQDYLGNYEICLE